jgi:uncharacterized protein YbjT (DUF2867 family)
MTTVLITGATGNVGMEVLLALQKMDHQLDLVAGVRDTNLIDERLSALGVRKVRFNFTAVETFLPAFQGIDILFLLRPPEIADVKKYFVPLIASAKQSSIQHIIFLSVQGVEHNRMIPHHKIEQLIMDSEIPYTFLRPAYFMQNFTTTLREDLVKNHRIYLPAGKSKFTLISTADIGSVAAILMVEPQRHIDKCYDLTSHESLTFAEMAEQISEGIGKPIKFISPNLLQFLSMKRKEGIPLVFILVMIMLHYFPRFQKPPKTSNCVQLITGEEPVSFSEFVRANKDQLI